MTEVQALHGGERLEERTKPMTNPMSDERRAEIRRDSDAVKQWAAKNHRELDWAHIDRADLLAEVDRLRSKEHELEDRGGVPTTRNRIATAPRQRGRQD